MRILLLSAASSVHTLRWANAYAAAGNEVHVVTQHQPVEGYVNVAGMHHLPHRSGLGYVLNGERLRRLIGTLEPDVVNAHYATGYGALARAVHEMPVVLNVWGSDVFDFPEKSALHRWWLRRNLLAADSLVSTSEVMADRVRALLPERPRPEVVPFGVDMPHFAPRAPQSRTDGPVVIGTVKTLAAKYGIDTLIKAFALLLTKPGMDGVMLRIVGGGPDGVPLRDMVGAAGLRDRVAFVGAVPHAQVPDELRKMDVFVALSRDDSESFGVAVIEASACGLPVVVSDAGGLPEVVVDGVTGSVVPRNDPASAARELALLAGSRALRMERGAAGREHVRQHYEWGACVQRMSDILQRCIARYRGR